MTAWFRRTGLGRPLAFGLAFASALAAAVAVHYAPRRTSKQPRLSEPPGAAAWNTLAATLLKRADESADDGLNVDALDAANRALAVDPRNLGAHFHRALSLSRIGLIREAREAWQRYLTLDSVSPAADEALRRLHALGISNDATESKRLLGLAGRTSGADREAILKRLVAQFPQQTRTTAESVVMSEWADAALAGDSAKAAALLDFARAIGEQLRRRWGESLLADAVSAADRAGNDGAAQSLARAYVSYREGRLAHKHHIAGEAESKLRMAARGFQESGSPMSDVALYYVGSSLHEQQRLKEAAAILNALLAKPLRVRGYRALAAQIGWERGACLLDQGALTEALDVFTLSRAEAGELGEARLVASLNALIGSALDRTGDTAGGWKVRRVALEALSREGDEDTKRVVLEAAVNSAAIHRQWSRAGALLDLVIGAAESRRDAPVAAHAFSQLALLDVQRRDFRGAESHAAMAARWVAQVRDPALRARVSSDWSFARAMTLREREPRASLAAFDEAIGYYAAVGRRIELPRLYLERARAETRIGDRAGARRDLDSGLAVVEAERTHLRDYEQRTSLIAAAGDLFADAIGLADDDGDSARAFALSESERARSLIEMFDLGYEAKGPQVAPLSLAEIQAALAPDAAVVQYAALPDRVVAFAIRSDGFFAASVPSSLDQTTRTAARFRAAVRQGGHDLAAMTAAERLLWTPVETALHGVRHIAFVPDRHLSGTPLAALRDHSGRAVIETADVVVAPSSTLAIRASRAAGGSRHPNALAVAADVFDFARHPTLSPLPSARWEAAGVAQLYAQSRQLTGDGASRRAVLAALPHFEVVHIAAHGLANADVPARSALLLAPADGDSGELHAADVARLRLPKTKLVVLATCDSASRVVRGDGAENPALGFFAAGVPTIVANLGELDDDDSLLLMKGLHRRILAGKDPAAAVRELTLAEQSSRRSALHPIPRSAGIVVIGGSRQLVR